MWAPGPPVFRLVCLPFGDSCGPIFYLCGMKLQSLTVKHRTKLLVGTSVLLVAVAYYWLCSVCSYQIVYDFLRLILVEFLVPLAWPAVAVFVAWWFKDPIAGLIPRIRSLGKEGLQLSEAPAQPASPPEPADFPDRVVPLPTRPDLALWEDSVRKGLLRRGLADSPNSNDWLIRFGAGALKSLWLEKTARLIYGTQIGALKQLRDKGPQTEQELTPWFKEHRKRNPGGLMQRPFSNWMDFLLKSDLAILEEDKYCKGPLTDELLDFLDSSKIDETKNW